MSSNLPMIYDRSVCSKVGEGCPLVITQLLIIETPVYVRLPRINLGMRDFAPAINVQAYLSMEITFPPLVFFLLSFSLFVAPALFLSPFCSVLRFLLSFTAFRFVCNSVCAERNKSPSNKISLASRLVKSEKYYIFQLNFAFWIFSLSLNCVVNCPNNELEWSNASNNGQRGKIDRHFFNLHARKSPSRRFFNLTMSSQVNALYIVANTR